MRAPAWALVSVWAVARGQEAGRAWYQRALASGMGSFSGGLDFLRSMPVRYYY